MAKTITIKNTNEAAKFAVKNWNTGLNAIAGEEAVVVGDFPVAAGDGSVKFRYWELEQYHTVKAGESATVTTESDAEEAYYLGLNGVAGLEVTSA